MELPEAKQKFIQTWGAFGSTWGINKTMAQIHALLLVAEEPLSTEDIMKDLGVSRGNVNMNVRELMSWGIVHKVLKYGERKEFFVAEKDIYKTAVKIVKERRKQELFPVLEALEALKQEKIEEPGGEDFQKVIGDIHRLGTTADKMLGKMIKMDERWFTSSLFKWVFGK